MVSAFFEPRMDTDGMGKKREREWPQIRADETNGKARFLFSPSVLIREIRGLYLF
jgi:hypothetical protein